MIDKSPGMDALADELYNMFWKKYPNFLCEVIETKLSLLKT